jgi:hypothetical protein
MAWSGADEAQTAINRGGIAGWRILSCHPRVSAWKPSERWRRKSPRRERELFKRIETLKVSAGAPCRHDDVPDVMPGWLPPSSLGGDKSGRWFSLRLGYLKKEKRCNKGVGTVVTYGATDKARPMRVQADPG